MYAALKKLFSKMPDQEEPDDLKKFKAAKQKLLSEVDNFGTMLREMQAKPLPPPIPTPTSKKKTQRKRKQSK